MTKSESEQIISVIGTQLFQPIADLVAKLISATYRRPDRVGSTYYETGYSASIILLTVAAIESLTQRDRYFFRKANPSSNISGAPVEYAKTVLRYRRHRQLQELFEVRNAIAHNHIWEIDFSVPASGGRQHNASQLVAGTHRLRVIPPIKTRVPRTQRVRLNLQPNRLDRTDVAKALDVCIHYLAHLSNGGSKPIPLLRETIAFQGKQRRLADIVSAVQQSIH